MWKGAGRANNEGTCFLFFHRKSKTRRKNDGWQVESWWFVGWLALVSFMCLHSQFPSFFPIFRVVSIGVEVEKLLADPSSDLGLSTSVEFCGGTHLKNISHIGHLVITTEEAIAKGVRRIVAVTGPEAERAIQRSERLEQRLVNLSKRIAENKNLMEDRENFKRIGKEIIEFIQELSLQMLPYWRKDAIREIVKGLQKQLDTSDRQAKAAVTEKLLVEACGNGNNKTCGNKAGVEKFLRLIITPFWQPSLVLLPILEPKRN